MRDALRRFIRPSRDERRAQRGRDACILIATSYALLAFAYLWPADRATGAGLPVEWAAFLIRVLQFHIGLAVLAVAIYAVARRSWRTACAAVPLVALTLGPVAWGTVVVPDARPSSGPTTRVMSANLLVSNQDHDAVIKQIRGERPDVLVLQEYSARWDAVLKPGLDDVVHHATSETREDAFGTAVYSRTALPARQHSSPVLGSGETAQTWTVIEVIVGDLNLTETTPQHARLAAIGLRDAWDLRGRGRGATWPNNSFLRYLPGLRLDHVYVSDEISVRSVKIGRGNGSDHQPVTRISRSPIGEPADNASPAADAATHVPRAARRGRGGGG